MNLCELAEEDDRSASSRSIINVSHSPSIENEHHLTHSSPATFNSTMISGRAHLNELQKENREPPPPPPPLHSNPMPLSSSSSSSSNRSSLSNPSGTTSPNSPSILADTITTLENYRLS